MYFLVKRNLDDKVYLAAPKFDFHRFHRSSTNNTLVEIRARRCVLAYQTNRINHLCSVGTGKPQPEGPPVQWETRLEFPTGMVDPRVGIFLSTLNVNDRFFFSHAQ